MSGAKRALLLVGSPKGSKSTSESLGAYLLVRLAEKSLKTDAIRIVPSLTSEAGQEKLRAALVDADLLVLSFPLYVDSHPATVIQFMELVARRWKADLAGKRRMLAAIANCGFPESQHCRTALAITRRFAVESNIEWAGGLALGGGGAIDGKPLAEAGGMARSIRRSLDLAADALAEGKPIPEEAVALMAKPLMPTWMYSLVGNLGWRRQAWNWGAYRKLRDRPFAVGPSR